MSHHDPHLISARPTSVGRRCRRDRATVRGTDYASPALRRLARRRSERGIILVFVVVLLSLLAVMGTAYLATSRTDRQAIANNGRGVVPGATVPRLFDRGRIDDVMRGSMERIQVELIADLFNLQPGQFAHELSRTGTAPAERLFGAFRQLQPASRSNAFGGPIDAFFYENYDATGPADPFLASLLPTNPATDDCRWPWISAPITGEPRQAGSISAGGGANGVARQILPGVDVEPFFADPTDLQANGTWGNSNNRVWADQRFDTVANINDAVTERRDVRIGFKQMLREDATLEQSKNTRVYPALVIGGGTIPNDIRMAADADGDGIADSGLMPVVLNPGVTNSVDRYLDPTNNVVYFVGYRVVDNSAQLNLSTALAVQGDVVSTPNFTIENSANGGTPANTDIRNAIAREQAPGIGFLDGPNLGLFRSNVGAVELLREAMRPFDQNVDASQQEQRPSLTQGLRFAEARMPLARPSSTSTDPGAIRVPILEQDPNVPPPIPPVRPDAVSPYFAIGTRNTITAAATTYQFRSLGDLLEQVVANRLQAPGLVQWVENGAPTAYPNGFVGLPVADGVSLAALGGSLLSDRQPAAGESEMAFALRWTAPNFTTGTSPSWRWFPPQEFQLWYDWTKSFAPDMGGGFGDVDYGRVSLLDYPADDDQRIFRFQPTAGSSGMAEVRLPKSFRTLLTTYSGVTANTAQRADDAWISPTYTTLLPPFMPTYGTNADQYPAERVSASTGTKEQLYRAYWSAMTDQVVYLRDITTGVLEAKTRVKRALLPRFAPTSRVESQTDLDDYYRTGAVYDAFKPTDRHASAPINYADRSYVEGARHGGGGGANREIQVSPSRLGEKQMALLRAAIAACNTIDLRDADQDVTAMTVDLGTFGGVDKMYARVYGTEKGLIITGVVIDDDDQVGATPPAVYVELHNPTDEPIDLAAYRLGIVARSTDTPETLATGDVGLPPGPNLLTAVSTLPPTTPPTPPTPQLLQPGGFVILSNVPIVDTETGEQPLTGVKVKPAREAPTGRPGDNEVVAPQVIHNDAATELVKVQPAAIGDPRDRELVLVRTRRADGTPSVENPDLATTADPKRPPFGEGAVGPAAGASLLTLVPVDAVDLRTLEYPEVGPIGNRYIYLRTTGPYTHKQEAPSPYLWRNFYAGNFYDRTSATATMTPAVRTAAGTWPWREYPVDPSVVRTKTVTLGQPHYSTAPVTAADHDDVSIEATPFFTAPAIPIQNFKPYASVPLAPAPNEFPLHKFPYGSPFARDGDVLAVPFVGSYKLYRVTPALATELYEYVPLPMDAVAAAPAATQDTINVGRFDAQGLTVSIPATGTAQPTTSAPPPSSGAFAEALFDFVTARHAPRQTYFPNIPKVEFQATGPSYNDPAKPETDQDGPVQGYTTATEGQRRVPNDGGTPMTTEDPAFRTPWVAWKKSGSAPTAGSTSFRRAGAEVSAAQASTLIAGTINLNTAPAIVRRMLPLAVIQGAAGARGGQVPFEQNPPAGPINDAAVLQRKRAALIDEYCQRLARRDLTDQPFGITSIAVVPQILNYTPALTPVPPTVDEAMMLGDLQPYYKPAAAAGYGLGANPDPVAANRELTRISNLVSQRSDVFTVYVTVQAWTWNTEKQDLNTRLVGEVRRAFIVDRSAISQTKYKPLDLTVINVDEQ